MGEQKGRCTPTLFKMCAPSSSPSTPGKPHKDNADEGNDKKDEGKVFEEKSGNDPFTRLVSTPTKSFTSRTEKRNAPKDSLDIAMSACYDQHRHWWAQKSLTVMQRATKSCSLLDCPHDVVILPLPCHSLPCYDRLCAQSHSGDRHDVDKHPPSSSTSTSTPKSVPYRNDPNHVHIGLAGPYLANSSRGFGRSIDGVFYNL